jgi:hypothetical protein
MSQLSKAPQDGRRAGGDEIADVGASFSHPIEADWPHGSMPPTRRPPDWPSYGVGRSDCGWYQQR